MRSKVGEQKRTNSSWLLNPDRREMALVFFSMWGYLFRLPTEVFFVGEKFQPGPKPVALTGKRAPLSGSGWSFFLAISH
jgi:hypothetical protein